MTAEQLDKDKCVDALLGNEPLSIRIEITDRGGAIVSVCKEGKADIGDMDILGGYAGHAPVGQALRLTLAFIMAPERQNEFLQKLASINNQHDAGDDTAASHDTAQVTPEGTERCGHCGGPHAEIFCPRVREGKP